MALKSVKLATGLATLRLDDGVLLPAAAVDGKTVEMVFLGKGRLELEPPDEVEAGQLELFTGGSRLDEGFSEMVLVMGLDAAADALMKKPKAAPDAAQLKRAEEIYAKWKGGPERKLLGVEDAILTDVIGDPAGPELLRRLVPRERAGGFPLSGRAGRAGAGDARQVHSPGGDGEGEAQAPEADLPRTEARDA